MEMTTKRTTVPSAEAILGKYFPVLDHGFVALVDYMGSDEDIERAARTSYGFGTRKVSKTRGLVRYLKSHRHSTPLEMVELKFHCSMPIFIARQWIRHRTANVNEMSGRYSILPMLFYTPEPGQWGQQSSINRQGRQGGLSAEMVGQITDRLNEQRRMAVDNYEWMTSNDVARELARIDLPLSTYTQWYWKIDAHNLMHFLSLRVDSHAQLEFQLYGQVMAGMLKAVAPLAYEAWVDYDVCGVHLSREEWQIVIGMLSDGGESVAFHIEHSGLSQREKDEFSRKLGDLKPLPDFSLDVSKAKDSAFFEEKMTKSVPGQTLTPTNEEV